jgi:lysozyme
MSALTSLAYNIGLSAFSTSTLLRKVNGNPDDQSIADEFRRWNKVNGAVIRGLVNRRNEEAKIYFSPIENVAQV